MSQDVFFVLNRLRVLSDVTGYLVGGFSPSPLKNDGRIVTVGYGSIPMKIPFFVGCSHPF